MAKRKKARKAKASGAVRVSICCRVGRRLKGGCYRICRRKSTGRFTHKPACGLSKKK